MAHVINCTPHQINIIEQGSVTFKAELRKFVPLDPDGKAEIIATIEPSGILLNAKYEQEERPSVNGIRVSIKRLTHCDPIPETCDIAIVSGLYAAATSDERAHTIIDPVYTRDGKTIIGCLALGRVVNK